MESDVFQKKIAIVAPNASARFGGEAILPLHYFTFLRKKNVDVLLVVHDRVRDELTEVLGEDIDRVIFVPDTKLHQFINGFGNFMPRRIYEFSLGTLLQFLTEFTQRKILRDLAKEGRIDITHQPSPVSPKTPSLFSGIGTPVVIGPLNGGMSFPPGFAGHQSVFERVFMTIGRTASELINHLLTGKKEADVILVANQRTAGALPKCVQGKVIELVENGVDLNRFTKAEGHPSRNGEPYRFVYVGRLVDWKSIDTLIKAMTQFSDGEAELHILGDGDERQALEALSSELGVNNSVEFHGFISQKECAEFLKTCDCLVLSSLYECGGAVVLEAMAMGLPAVATNWGGPADYLDAETGVLVEVGENKEAFDKNFAQAMKSMQQSPDKSKAMGVAGHKKVMQDFDWNKKVDKMIEVYRNL